MVRVRFSPMHMSSRPWSHLNAYPESRSSSQSKRARRTYMRKGGGGEKREGERREDTHPLMT